jgi:ABC-2 type transport system permease protein
MTQGGIAWFAAHEARLAWRDWRRIGGRGYGMALAILGIVVVLHLIALLIVRPAPDLASHPSTDALITIVGMLVLSWSLMLSQAMESVTRVFYTRGDLELILSSPVATGRLFVVRIVAMAVGLAAMSLVIAAPFINVLVWRAGMRWLAVYPAVLALAVLAVAVAITAVIALFHTIGPKRTRLIAQIIAAFIGAIFAVALQIGAIQSFGTPDRLAFLRSDAVARLAPPPDSALWGIAHAAMGEPVPLAVLSGIALLALGIVVAVFVPRFPRYVRAASGIAHGDNGRGGASLRGSTSAQVLRAKEWALLRRDPWLVSQTLVQILYLLPAAYLLWRGFGGGLDAVTLLVPVLVTASGQFAGGLAWLAISGEDAPDLIASAPISPAQVARAKFEATIGGSLFVFAPFVLGMAAVAPAAALAACAGIVLAAASATAIQYWFRLQAYRGRIRRRQTASRLTTYAEALISVSWAAAAALASASNGLALIPAVAAVLVLALARALAPAGPRNRRPAAPLSRPNPIPSQR